MSRNPNDRVVSGRYSVQPDAASENADDSLMIDQLISLYGEDAPTAVAYCAIEAWSEGNDDEYRFWSRVFQRLRN